MKKPTKRAPRSIPHFRNDAEAAAFWDTHDSTDYLHDLRPVKLTFTRPRPQTSISIRIAKSDAARLARIAARKRLASASLLRTWIRERLLDEAQAAKR